MASVNKVILIGNLGKDPEVRYTQGGQPVCNFSIATSETWNDKDGNKQEKTEWHSVTVWGKQAEHCGQYLAKGRSVYVEGRLESREYDDKEGNKRKVWEVTASSVTFLGSKGDDSGAGAGDGQRGGSGGGGFGGNSGGGQGGQRGGQQQGNGGSWGGGGSGGQQRQQGGQHGGGNSGRGAGGWGGSNGNVDDDPIPF